MRILHVCVRRIDRPGIAASTARLVNWLARADVDTHAAFLRDPGNALLDPRVVVHSLAASPRELSPWNAVLLLRLSEITRQVSPDIIHIHEGHPWLGLLRLACPTPRFVLTLHDAWLHPGEANLEERVRHLAMRRIADAIVVHGSEEARRLVVRHRRPTVPVLSVQQGCVFFNSWDSACRARRNRGQVLFHGRFFAYKGAERIPRIVQLITHLVPTASFVVAGSGPDSPALGRALARCDHVRLLLRWIGNQELSILFRQSAVVMLPYVDASESGVFLVASHFATPVVASAVGALPEQIVDGVTGLIAPASDDRELAERAAHLLRDTPEARALGERAKAAICRGNRWRDYGGGLIELYSRLC